MKQKLLYEPEILTWEDLEKFFHYSKGQARGKIQRKVWRPGEQYVKLDGEIRFLPEGIRAWINTQVCEQKEKGSKSATPKTGRQGRNSTTGRGTRRTALRPVE